MAVRRRASRKAEVGRDRRGLRVVGPDEQPPPKPPHVGWPPFVEEWLLPYLREPSLWPVAVAVLGHVVVVLAPLMLVLWRTGSVAAGMALGVLLVASLWPVRWEVGAQGRPGCATGVLVVVWVVSGLTAWLAGDFGLL